MGKHTSDSAYFGALVTFLSGLTLNDIAAIAGILFGLFTILINWYYKQKDYELHRLEIEKRIAKDEKDRR